MQEDRQAKRVRMNKQDDGFFDMQKGFSYMHRKAGSFYAMFKQVEDSLS
jgi:hypothetical protein